MLFVNINLFYRNSGPITMQSTSSLAAINGFCSVLAGKSKSPLAAAKLGSRELIWLPVTET